MNEKNNEIIQWIIKADHDLGTAKITYLHIPDYLDTTTFHCQQAVEKYLKGYLIFLDIEFKRYHDLIYLLELITPKDPEIQKYLESYYSPERVRREIEARNIVSDQSDDKIMPASKELFRENRFIDPKKFPIMFEGLIFGSKVGFANFEAGSQLGAIIIESEEIAKSMRSLFDFAWQSADK